jgi:serine/threonine-protein kinase
MSSSQRSDPTSQSNSFGASLSGAQAPTSAPTAEQQAELLAPFQLSVGATVGAKYKIEHVLGSGGMGVVLLAVHVVLHQRVAIKLLRPELAQDAIHVERFLREALASAQLKNQHVVRVIDVDKLASGVPYLVMEWLEGRDLSRVLVHRGPLPVQEAVHFVLQACEAVAEAHSRGIVHRDLKLSNLFLTRTADGHPCIKVLDFGISKVESADPSVGLTGTSIVLGSPLHMSPEQFRSPRGVDRRTDIWSVGTLLFELLAGRPPFIADNAPALIAKIAADQPDRLTAFRQDIPAGLEAVILSCLEKERDRRIQSVLDLVRALVPFGPAEAQVHASRIERMSEPPADAQRGSLPIRGGDTIRAVDITPPGVGQGYYTSGAGPGQSRYGSQSGANRTSESAGLGPAGSPAQSTGDRRTGPSGSVAGWGTTNAPFPVSPRKSPVRVLAGLGVGLALVVIVAVWLIRGSGSTSVAAVSSAAPRPAVSGATPAAAFEKRAEPEKPATNAAPVVAPIDSAEARATASAAPSAETTSKPPELKTPPASKATAPTAAPRRASAPKRQPSSNPPAPAGLFGTRK